VLLNLALGSCRRVSGQPGFRDSNSASAGLPVASTVIRIGHTTVASDQLRRGRSYASEEFSQTYFGNHRGDPSIRQGPHCPLPRAF
jgi:hypothetical protein